MKFSKQHSKSWQYTCLHATIIQNLLSNSIIQPTSIQQQVYAQYPYHYDFLISSQTGSGKTYAFIAPILSQLLTMHSHIQLPGVVLCMVITPTRQLAEQIYENTIQIKTEAISVGMIIGGMSKDKQIRIIKNRRPHIIIGTPGRLNQLIQDSILDLMYVKYVVLDQADRMVELGHFKDVDKILEHIYHPKKQQYYDQYYKQIVNKEYNNVGNKRDEQQEFYIKQNGKKVKPKINLQKIKVGEIFEVPSNIFQLQNKSQTNKQKKQKNQKQINKNNKLLKQEKKINSNKFKDNDSNIIIDKNIIQMLKKIKRRTFFVSATLTHEFKGTKYNLKRSILNKQKQQNKTDHIPKLKALMNKIQFVNKPKIIDQSALLFLPIYLNEQICYSQGQIQRISLLLCYLNEIDDNSKIIIFTNTIKIIKRLQYFVQSSNRYRILILHSHLQQKQRLKRIQQFKANKGSKDITIMIATDVAARGLDFQLNYVVQYGVPLNGDTYVHRVGRTARAGKSGYSIILVDKKEHSKWNQINEIITQSVPSRKINSYKPTQIMMSNMEDKVQEMEWIRVHDPNRNLKMKLNDKQIQEQQQMIIKKQPKNKNNQEQQYNKQLINKHISYLQKNNKTRNTNRNSIIENNNSHSNIVWKKNKLVLSSQYIKKIIEEE